MLCIEDKLCICTHASKGEKPASLAMEFGVDTVIDILTNSIIRTFWLSKHSQGPMSSDNGGTTVHMYVVLKTHLAFLKGVCVHICV